MEASRKNPYILPTLQTNFHYVIGEILKRMNNLGISETWKAIETLFCILPPTIHKEMREDYTSIVKKVNMVTNLSSVDFLQMVESNAECCQILEEFAVPFFRRMYELLYDGGYLEKTQREVPIGKE